MYSGIKCRSNGKSVITSHWNIQPLCWYRWKACHTHDPLKEEPVKRWRFRFSTKDSGQSRVQYTNAPTAARLGKLQIFCMHSHYHWHESTLIPPTESAGQWALHFSLLARHPYSTESEFCCNHAKTQIQMIWKIKCVATIAIMGLKVSRSRYYRVQDTTRSLPPSCPPPPSSAVAANNATNASVPWEPTRFRLQLF